MTPARYLKITSYRSNARAGHAVIRSWHRIIDTRTGKTLVGGFESYAQAEEWLSQHTRRAPVSRAPRRTR